MSVEVLEAGSLTTVQDGGRPGWAHLGVPRSGFLDAPAARFANRLVGNRDEDALLETTLSGVVLRTRRALRVAVAGARAGVRVDGRPRAFGAALSVPAGAVVEVGAARDGVRSYVAFAGGIATSPVLGSRSTDTLAGLGTPVVRDGDVLPLGPPGPPGAPSPVTAPVRRQPARAGGVGNAGVQTLLRVVPGPRADWLDDLGALAGARFRVGESSNRVGLRLEGESLRRRPGELPSEGIVLGAVQLPASGQPIVFLNDHPTTGGYPVVAVVVTDDLPLCAQLRPGDEVALAAG